MVVADPPTAAAPVKQEPTRIWRAYEAEQIASEEAIPTWHPDLADARVLFLFTNKERKSGGKVVVAKTSKLTGANKYLSSGKDEDIDEGYDFMVLISEDEWLKLSDTQRRALVDHELSHCVVEETEDGFKYKIQSHDIEEFSAVVRRHGAWNHQVREFIGTVLQLPMFGERDFKSQVGQFLDEQGIAYEQGAPVGTAPA